jgi:hypothetical protein
MANVKVRTIPAFAWRDWKTPRKTEVRIVGGLAEIGTGTSRIQARAVTT